MNPTEETTDTRYLVLLRNPTDTQFQALVNFYVHCCKGKGMLPSLILGHLPDAAKQLPPALVIHSITPLKHLLMK